MSEILPRHVEPIASEYLAHFPSLIIEGARQVGKSTLARRIADKDAYIVNLDDDQVREAALEGPEGFLAQAGSRQMVIDEIQRLPQMTLAVKSAIDKDRRPGRFILTGSSSLLRVKGPADSLAGRTAMLDLYGLSQGELNDRHDDFAGSISSMGDEVVGFVSSVERSDYVHVLSQGSYPELRTMPDHLHSTWVSGYLRGIIGRDLRELNRQVDSDRAMSVLRVIAGRQSAELVKAKLALETDIPARTVTGYLDLLRDVGLLGVIPPWMPNLAKREIGRAKSYVIDSAVALWLTRLTPAQLDRPEYSESFGSMLEAFVAAELVRQAAWTGRRFDLFHYRGAEGSEVDLILEFEDGTVLAIEVKAAASYTAKQFTGLKKLRDLLGDRLIAGVVLGTAPYGYRFGPKLYGLPIAALWELSQTQ